MLDNFKWYRKLRGGTWRLIYVKYINVMFWERNKIPYLSEHVVEIEEY